MTRAAPQRRAAPQADGAIVIRRPVEEVFDFVADERNLYDPRMVRAEKISEGPIGVGTRFRTEAKSAGRTVGMVVEITEYERPRRLSSSTRLSWLDVESTLLFDAVPDGTRLRWSSTLAPRGPLKRLKPVLAWVGRRQGQAIWESLKRVLEDGERRPRAGR